MTSDVQLTDDDDAADGGVFLEIFPVAAAPVVITSVGTVNINAISVTGNRILANNCRGNRIYLPETVAVANRMFSIYAITSVGNDSEDLLHRQTDVPGPGVDETNGPSSAGNYVSGLARSSSDVTSQRRFHRRRSAVKCPTGLAPVSGLYVSASYALAPRLGSSCSAIGDTCHGDREAVPGSSGEAPPNDTEMDEQPPVPDELDSRDHPSSEPGSRQQLGTTDPETDGCVREPPVSDQRRSTVDSTQDSSRSSDSRDVAITVEVCDTDDERLDGPPPRTCHMSIPPVTISSHASTPDDEPAGLSSQFASSVSSPAVHSRLNYVASADSNPNLLSVSRTGTFSSGGSTKNCSRRPSNHQTVVDAQDVISVDSVSTSRDR